MLRTLGDRVRDLHFGEHVCQCEAAAKSLLIVQKLTWYKEHRSRQLPATDIHANYTIEYMLLLQKRLNTVQQTVKTIH
jgi:hypothetical protein